MIASNRWTENRVVHEVRGAHHLCACSQSAPPERKLGIALVGASQRNLLGDPDSCGVWAPCLTHADGRFWLVYTDAHRYGRTTVGGASGASLRDFHNYLVSADHIDGAWSDPDTPILTARLRSEVALQRAGHEDFDGPTLPIDFQRLRSPWPNELFSLTARPGWLRLFGRESLGSVFKQSLARGANPSALP